MRCYLPEAVDETWGRLRHLGARRSQLLDTHTRCVQQIRDLLECVWPAALTTAKQPFKSITWVAALTVLMGRDGGDFGRTARLGKVRFERLVRAEVIRCGRTKPCLRILNKLWEAMADPAGVTAHRLGGFERISWILAVWEAAKSNLVDVAERMTTALDQLGLTRLVTSIDGLSPVGAAAILAETGDLTRFTSARAIVKLAGLAPRERLSGTFTGKARLSGAGRPGLRTAAWRAVWGCVRHNSVYMARYRHLTTRDQNKLKPTQAQTAIAAALLRQLWAVITTGQAWNADIAANGLHSTQEVTAAA